MVLKQVILLRRDLGMSLGKLISQSCHAAVGAYSQASAKSIAAWEKKGAKKIALFVPDGKELNSIYSIVKTMNLPSYMVQDAGHTELAPGTRTALGIGPATTAEIDKITGDLSLV